MGQTLLGNWKLEVCSTGDSVTCMKEQQKVWH